MGIYVCKMVFILLIPYFLELIEGVYKLVSNCDEVVTRYE